MAYQLLVPLDPGAQWAESEDPAAGRLLARETLASAMRIAMTLLTAFIVALLFGVVAIFSGIYDVSALSRHGDITNWVMSTTMHASVERRARDIIVPNLDDDELRRAGISDYDAMCIGCHGAPGRDPDPTGQGLNPPAPDLRDSAQNLTIAELFWITKHGIRMTGMPAWGATHKDDELWPVVAFLQVLPKLDAPTYQSMLAAASEMGHHDSEHEHPASANERGTVDEESHAEHDH